MGEYILAVLVEIRDIEKKRIQAERIKNLDILDTDDASYLLGYKVSYIQKLVEKNYIPHYKSANGKKVFFKKAELEDWATTISCPTDSQIASQASEYIIKSNKN